MEDGKPRAPGGASLTRHLPRAGLLLVAIAVVLLIALESTERRAAVHLDADRIRHADGLAFIVDLDGYAGPLRTWRGDTPERPASSSLTLLEDGVPLGPAHAPHQLIRERGAGLFSHWRSSLVFSTSNGDDPRYNARRYTVQGTLETGRLAHLALAALAVLGLAALAVAHRASLAGAIGDLWHVLREGRWLDRLSNNRRARPLLAAALALVWVSAVAVPALAPSVDVVLSATDISHEEGHGYHATPVVDVPWPYFVEDDSAHNPSTSRVTLYEDDTPLGPAHALHAELRARGGGRYSHWVGRVIFSTSDNTDPRSNGRVYRLHVPLSVHGSFWLITIVLIVVLALPLDPERVLGLLRAAALPRPGLGHGRAVLVLALILSTVACARVLSHWTLDVGPYATVAGFQPYADARGYQHCATEIAATGSAFKGHPGICSRRATYPSVLAGLVAISGFRPEVTLLLQAVLVASMIAVTVAAVAQATGVVASVFAAAVIATFADQYAISVFMTEVTGLFFGLAALVLTLSLDSRPRQAIALGMLIVFTIGMMSRVGAMFSLPAAWLGVCIAFWRLRGFTWRLPVLGIGAGILGALVQPALSYIAELPSGGAMGNFAATLYGLSVGAHDWSQAYVDFRHVFQTSGQEAAFSAIYRAAFENIMTQPGVLLESLARTADIYWQRLFAFSELAGPVAWMPGDGTVLRILFVLGLGVCAVHWRRPSAIIALLVMLGEIASAPFIAGDGGTRVFAATVPMRAAVVAIAVAFLCRALVAGIHRMAGRRLAQHARGDPRPDREYGSPWRVAVLLSGVTLAAGFVVGTPVAAPVRLSAAQGIGCPDDAIEVVTRPGRESLALLVVESDEGTSSANVARKHWVVQEAERRGHYYIESLRALDTPVTLLFAFQRREGNLGSAFAVRVPGRVPFGQMVSMCIGKESKVNINAESYQDAHSVTILAPGDGHRAHAASTRVAK